MLFIAAKETLDAFFKRDKNLGEHAGYIGAYILIRASWNFIRMCIL